MFKFEITISGKVREWLKKENQVPPVEAPITHPSTETPKIETTTTEARIGFR